MHTAQRQHALAQLRTRGIDAALFANPALVTWLTGFAPNIQLGPHPFAGGPPLVWVVDDHFYLIVVDAHTSDAAAFGQQPDGTVISYEGYTIDHATYSYENLKTTLHDLLRQTLLVDGGVGLEVNHLPYHLVQTVMTLLSPRHQQRAIDGLFRDARMVKTSEEIDKLRENFRLAEVGQAAAKAAIGPGKREIDVWAEVHSAINREAGQRVAAGNDLVVSSRPNNIGGWPQAHTFRAGDTVTVDIGTRFKGYWSDSCASYAVGEPTRQQMNIRRVVSEALDLAISLVKPGAVAHQIDEQIRAFIEKAGLPVYPHHTGHGVGTTSHEEPRIVPYSEVILQPGMVIMLEPGVYLPGKVSIRHEDAVLVTADGAEVLTHHAKH